MMIENFVENQELIFSINKPLGWTSFDVVKKIRNSLGRVFKIRKLKVGHAGTLDPLADGVLVICVGKATKKIDQIQLTEKEYIAHLKLGATTPSFDAETEEDYQFDYLHIDEALIKAVLPQFIGEIEQCPPLFSAVKIEGKRAYKYARNGEEVEMPTKLISIKEVEILNFELPLLSLKITCGKGTYIRSLARDLGVALKSGAYLVGLTRTRVGEYTVENSVSVADFENECDNLSLELEIK